MAGLAGLMLALAGAPACTKRPPALTLPDLSLSDPSFPSTVEAITGKPIVGGNRVDILLNGDETFPAIVESLKSAKRSITFEAYIFRKSEVAVRIVEALVDRCRAGVRVSVLLDARGSATVPDEYVDGLRDAGCRIVPDFRPVKPWQPRRSNLRTHRRIVVVDGRIGFTGGYGVDEQWMGDGQTKGRWRDTNVRLEGPVVQQLQAAFSEHWFEATGELLGGADYYPYPAISMQDAPARVQVVASSPIRDHFSLHRLFLQTISAAQRSILISTPYLLPGDQMTEALKSAARRGVHITVLVPSVIHRSWLEYLVQETHREEFPELLEAGVELYEYHPALLHTKAMVIDGVWSTVGSTNLDNRSMGMNDELNAVFYDPPVATKITEILKADIAQARRLTEKNLNERGWVGRLFGFLTVPLQDQF